MKQHKNWTLLAAVTAGIGLSIFAPVSAMADHHKKVNSNDRYDSYSYKSESQRRAEELSNIRQREYLRNHRYNDYDDYDYGYKSERQRRAEELSNIRQRQISLRHHEEMLREQERCREQDRYNDRNDRRDGYHRRNH